MDFRSIAIAGAVISSFALTACGSSSSGSCSSAADIVPTVSALTDELQKAEGDGKIDRAKVAESMSRVLAAGQTYVSNQDVRAYCAELAKIRHDSGL